MTGYLTPPLPLLFPHEKLFVQASYCSICNNLFKRKLYLNRYFLNYDAIFFYLLFLSANPSYKFTIKPFFCKSTLTNRFFIEDNGILSYFSDYSTLFSSLKFLDNFQDEKFPISSLSYIIFKKLFNSLKYLDKKMIIDFINKENASKPKKIFYNNDWDLDKNKEIENLILLIENNFPFDYINYSFRNNVSSILSNLIKLLFYIDAIDDFNKDYKKNQNNILYDLNTKNIKKIKNINIEKSILRIIKNECTFSLNYCVKQLDNLPNKDFIRILKIYFSDLIPFLLDKALLKNNYTSIFLSNNYLSKP